MSHGGSTCVSCSTIVIFINRPNVEIWPVFLCCFLESLFEPLMRMRKAVFKHSRAKIVYVMNGWNRFKASRDFMEWFEGLAGDQTVVTLPQSEAFVQAGAAGVSVVQFDRRGKAARATRALVDTVREAAGFPRE